jgi:putative transposase
MKSHIAKLRRETRRFTYWNDLGAQAIQDVLERLEKGYQRFFSRLAKHPPKFKQVKRYKSFTLKQTGWKLVEYNKNRLKPNGKYGRARSVVVISGQEYKFIQHYPMGSSNVKTVTIKRDACQRLWICFSVVERIKLPEKASTCRIGGFDFGLKTFLTDEQGRRWMHPLFFKPQLKRVKILNRAVSQKVKGSGNREAARWLLARSHIRIADKRRDFHFKLAHALCEEYDVLVFEDLNLEGMKRLWGQKVSDLAFDKFLKRLEWVALKRGKTVIYIDRFERTTGKCFNCKHEQPMTLKERTFHCQNCGLELDRDHNAALNILYAGASAYTGLGTISLTSVSSPVIQPKVL